MREDCLFRFRGDKANVIENLSSSLVYAPTFSRPLNDNNRNEARNIREILITHADKNNAFNPETLDYKTAKCVFSKQKSGKICRLGKAWSG